MSSVPAPTLPPNMDPSVDVRCDVLVIGGGVNGAGIARDLAGRGWSVVLCEQDDLACHTSSSSSKLIHGGLRYLAYGDFGLVRKALIEREILLRGSPHIMRPLQFVLPHDRSMRPVWMIRLGLWLYDHLAPRNFLPASERVSLRDHVAGAPLQAQWQSSPGFTYADGWVDDARLVVLCAKDAAGKGAKILTRTRCTQLQRGTQGWQALLAHHDAHTGRLTHHVRVSSRLVVNAAGPWADQLQAMIEPGPGTSAKLRLIKGSHVVVPRLFTHEHAYILQQPDGRVVFAIPYEQRFTLIGTTDEDHHDSPGACRISEAEVSYLCDAVNRYFRQRVTPEDVLWHFSGVRPLLDDDRGSASAVTRDYRLDHGAGPHPWLTCWGGKITTFRKLAEEAAHLVGDLLNERRSAWTSEAKLPGGNLLPLIDTCVDPETDLGEFQQRLRQRYPWIDLAMARRWSRLYGSDALNLLDGMTGREDLGAEVAPGLHEAELFYLRQQEWACTGDDVLWRRTKLGLHFSEAHRQAVIAWMQAPPVHPST